MRFHILGTQGIGFLIAHILKRNNHDVTLLLRDRLSLANFMRKDRMITVHYQNDAVETSNGYQLEVPGMGVNGARDVGSNVLAHPLTNGGNREYGLGGNIVKNADPVTEGHYHFPSNSLNPSLRSFSYSPFLSPNVTPISSLIIATSLPDFFSAFSRIFPRILPTSTIIIFHHGTLGIYEDLIQTYFREPSVRPNIVLADATHRCYTRGQFEVMIERLGRVYFGIVPGEDGREVRVRSMTNQRNEKNGVEPDGFDSEKEKSNPENNNINSKNDTINSFSTTQSSLHSTISILTSLPLLSFTRLFYPVVIDHLLEKLLLNACLAPISTLFNVKYGSLLYNMPANRVLKKVVNEASAVVRAYRGFVIGGFLEAERKVREANMAGKETSDTDKEFGSDAVVHEESAQAVSCDEPLKLGDSRSSSPKPQFTSSTTHSSRPSQFSVSPFLLLPLTNRFGPDRILDAVFQICNTHPHISSPMSSAILSCQLTDIDYVNGFIVKSGRMCGLSTPVNEFLVDAIKMKHRIMCRNRETGRKVRNEFKG
ncbi:10842_t:CDS:1 [Paraglomus occultum]|uniref:10842_t:CDS:1 n=1 Tax=Paraglomus occultum TaxID=144539 RepID=A0A9N8VIC1_9GLOM|nr:10842_t:CDS:1 [Paraglomus occultum]